MTWAAGRRGAGTVALGVTLTLGLAAGCSSQAPPAAAPSPSATAAVPAYDASLEPAAAILALVPDQAVTLTVTDLDQIRLQLGDESLTGASPVAQRDAFWAQAAAKTALLTRGMLRPVDHRLSSDYGFTEDDVAFEAHFFDAGGAELGWILGFRPGTDFTAVQRAITDRVGPLAGGTVHAGQSLVTSGITLDGSQSWASNPETRTLVGDTGDATYVERACLPSPTAAGADLDPLVQWSVVFGDELATAHLAAPTERTDLFARLQLAEQTPGFGAGYAHGVADPSSGRIGFDMVDPPTAAQLALRGQLPFAACS